MATAALPCSDAGCDPALADEPLLELPWGVVGNVSFGVRRVMLAIVPVWLGRLSRLCPDQGLSNAAAGAAGAESSSGKRNMLLLLFGLVDPDVGVPPPVGKKVKPPGGVAADELFGVDVPESGKGLAFTGSGSPPKECRLTESRRGGAPADARSTIELQLENDLWRLSSG